MAVIIFTQADINRFERLMSQFKLQIKSKMIMYGKWVTGTTWNSITPYANCYNNTLSLGLKSSNPTVMAVQETGRKPGKVPIDFERTIFQWSMAKGIQFSSQKERWSFANAVKWKTIKEGSSQFRQGRNDDIFTKPFQTYDRQIATIIDKNFKDNFYKLNVNFL